MNVQVQSYQQIAQHTSTSTAAGAPYATFSHSTFYAIHSPACIWCKDYVYVIRIAGEQRIISTMQVIDSKGGLNWLR